jgi:hypothetical protein
MYYSLDVELFRRVIHFGPESWQWGSGSFVLRGGGGSQEWAVAFLGMHTPLENPAPVSEHKHTSLTFFVVKSRKFSQENGFASNREPSSISAKEGSSMPSTAKPADMSR